jgi:uncharacterized YigZ family protein
LKDTFKTFDSETDQVLFKEKSSKFFGYGFPIQAENEVKPIIEVLRKKHFGAVHFCYAYQIGSEKVQFRANDDGEPSNTAGMPIYGQIQSFEITNVLIVVVRYFGGTKLGVGGLISAYKSTALMVIEVALIIEKTIDVHYIILFDYKNMNKVMRVIKEKNIKIITQKMEDICEIEIASRKKNAMHILEIFNSMFEVEIKEK